MVVELTKEQRAVAMDYYNPLFRNFEKEYRSEKGHPMSLYSVKKTWIERMENQRSCLSDPAWGWFAEWLLS